MHTMTMITEHEGTEEWLCTVCGRHLLVSWNPVFKKTVLSEGDPFAQHTGLKNNALTMNRVDVAVEKTPLPEATEESIDEARLLPWLTWMEEIGFEQLWHGDAL